MRKKNGSRGRAGDENPTEDTVVCKRLGGLGPDHLFVATHDVHTDGRILPRPFLCWEKPPEPVSSYSLDAKRVGRCSLVH